MFLELPSCNNHEQNHDTNGQLLLLTQKKLACEGVWKLCWNVDMYLCLVFLTERYSLFLIFSIQTHLVLFTKCCLHLVRLGRDSFYVFYWSNSKHLSLHLQHHKLWHWDKATRESYPPWYHFALPACMHASSPQWAGPRRSCPPSSSGRLALTTRTTSILNTKRAFNSQHVPETSVTNNNGLVASIRHLLFTDNFTKPYSHEHLLVHLLTTAL